jgi:hypothetical protein
VVQQAIMNRTGMGREMRERAAKRAAKKLGHPLPRRKSIASEK